MGDSQKLLFLLDRDYFSEGQLLEDEAHRSLMSMTSGKSADALDLFVEKWNEYLHILRGGNADPKPASLINMLEEKRQ